jgi:hypothetical protein
VVPIAVQAMRSLVPAVLLLLWPGAPLVVFAVMLPVGEGVRAAVLGVACRRLRLRQAREQSGDMTPYGLVSVGRERAVYVLLGLFSSTSVVGIYALAYRLTIGPIALITGSLSPVMFQRASVARDVREVAERARQMLRADARSLGGLAIALTVGAVVVAHGGPPVGPAAVRLAHGFVWGSLVMLSLPAHLFNVVGTRLLVIGRKKHMMLWIAAATAVLNAVLDGLFYLFLGSIGIILSTVVLRWTMAGVYLYLLRTVIPATIGREVARDTA